MGRRKIVGEFFDSPQTSGKKEDIRKEAIRLFIERGYANTSVREIAEASGISPSLILYHYKTKHSIASEFMNRKMKQMREVLMEIVDIRREPELFLCSFVRLYQTVMGTPVFCQFYHDMIDEGVFRKFFFEAESGINVSDLILAKRQVNLSPSMYSFYSHYIVPGMELVSWISEPGGAPDDAKMDVPFRILMGAIYVPQEEVEKYCRSGREIVKKIMEEHPEFMEYC